MQPNTRTDQFQPKWRHFHPQATVWVINPFDHEVVFRVADENNYQSEYHIQARERAELPGGAIATLGVKAIIDELIQNSKDDMANLYNLDVRARYEEKVILRVKDAPSASLAAGTGGPIDLSIKSDVEKKEEEKKKEEVAPFAEVPVNKLYDKPEQPVKATKEPVDKIAKASLGSKDQVVESD